MHLLLSSLVLNKIAYMSGQLLGMMGQRLSGEIEGGEELVELFM